MIGQKIRHLRQQLQLSQRQLAGKEMTRHFISLVESGRAVPSDRTLRIIAERLGKPVSYFTTDEGEQELVANAGLALLEAARHKLERGEVQTSIRLLTRIVSSDQDPYLLAESHYLLSMCQRELGDNEQAISHCNEAVTAYLQLGDRAGLVRVYLQMGAAAFALEDLPAARRAYDQAVRYSSELKSLLDVHIQALTYLGTTLVRLGDLDQAIVVYQRAWHECGGQATPEQSGKVAMGLGKALFQSGQLEPSCDWTHRAVKLLEQANSSDKVLALHNLAVMQAAGGAGSETQRTLQECLRIYRAMGRTDKQASVLEDEAWYWVRNGNHARARACCLEAIELLDVKDVGELRGRLYRVLGTIAEAEGDAEQAYYFLGMSYDLFRRMKAAHEAGISREAMNRLKGRIGPSGQMKHTQN